MGRQKNLENMTHEERLKYWEKKREEEAAERLELLSHLSDEMTDAVNKLAEVAADVGDDMQCYGSNSITVNRMHDLIDRSAEVRRLFNIGRFND